VSVSLEGRGREGHEAFDPTALAARYEAASTLPEGLLRRLLLAQAASTGGSLAERIAALAALRTALLARTDHETAIALRTEIFGDALVRTANDRALLRTFRDQLAALGPTLPDAERSTLVDTWLGDLLEAARRTVPPEDEIDALFRELTARKSPERRHLDDDQIAALMAEAGRERAHARAASETAEVAEKWRRQAEIWGALRGVYGPLGGALGLGWDLTNGVLRHVGFTQVAALSALLERAPELSRLVRSLGRLHERDDDATSPEGRPGPSVNTRVLRPLARTDRAGPTLDARAKLETRGVERSDSLARMLPSESALLLNPTLRRLFHARRTESALATYRVEGVGTAPLPKAGETLAPADGSAELDAAQRRKSRERGPIVILLDTSASMSGAPESIAKAVVLEACRVARAEARACWLIAFGGPNEIHELSLTGVLAAPKHGSAVEAGDQLGNLLHFLQASFQGGTDTAEPVKRALALLTRTEARNADVLLVSDGAFPTPRDLLPEVAAAREHGTRFHGLLVGETQRESEAMSALCDPLHSFSAWNLRGGVTRSSTKLRPHGRWRRFPKGAPSATLVLMRSHRFLPLASLTLVLAVACGPDPPTNGGDDLGTPPTAGAAGKGGAEFDPGPPPGPGNNGTGANGYGANGSGASNPGTGGNEAAGDGGSGGEGGTEPIEPPGPPLCDTTLRRCATALTYTNATAQSVEVRGDFAPGAWDKGVAMTKVDGVWTASIDVPWSTKVLYKLYVDGAYLEDPTNPNKVADGFGGFNSVLDPLTCEEWTCDDPPVLGTFDWRDAMLYFVFVDRFEDGDKSNNGAPVSGVDGPANYQGGDWAGVKKHVDEGYFNDLGVNALWLTVPMDNPDTSGVGDDGRNYSAYHGYWPSDLTKTEARFGTKEELKGLVDAAHAKGLKVILDYAMNHVHESSPTYKDHKDWFWPNQNGDQNCVCGQGCSWDDAEQARRCWFAPYLPDFNFKVDAARQYSVDNAIGWIKDTGIDGFRLDAVKHIEAQWLKDLRTRVKNEIEPASGEHFYTVGETFTGEKSVIKSYVDPDTMLDGQFDFPMRMEMARTVLMRQGSMKDFAGFLAGNDGYYGSGIMSTFIGNHDIPRSIHLAEDNPLWGDQWTSGKDRAWDNLPGAPGGTNAYERLGNAFTLLFTMRGVPLVYYGDEVGLAGGGDPDNRRMMQWSGYSAGQSTLLGHLKKLTKIRADHPALRRGTRKALGTTDDVLAYQMSTTGDTVLVAVNRGDGAQNAEGIPSGTYEDLLSGETVQGPSVNVKARGARILVAK
jgi:glycosidase/uncharacterized protein with von Willebrand factor type A (vWA) domain